MWLRRHLRFIMTAEMCSLWTPLRGDRCTAQPHSGATIASDARKCGLCRPLSRAPHSHACGSRSCSLTFDYYTALSEVHEDTRRTIATDSARASNQPPLKGNKQRSGKGRTPTQEGKKGKPVGKGTKNNRGKKGKDNASRPAGKGPSQLSTAPPLLPLRVDRLLEDKAAISNTSKGYHRSIQTASLEISGD